MENNKEIKLIGTVNFKDLKVKIYYDQHSNNNDMKCCWGVRNPDSFYRGIMYLNNDTGKFTYPEDAIVPEQTDVDREILPRFILTGRKMLDKKLVSFVKTYLNSDYERRNKN